MVSEDVLHPNLYSKFSYLSCMSHAVTVLLYFDIYLIKILFQPVCKRVIIGFIGVMNERLHPSLRQEGWPRNHKELQRCESSCSRY